MKTRTYLTAVLLIAVPLFIAGCGDHSEHDHDQDHNHDHAEHEHAEHDHDHADHDHAGHDHHADEHVHAEDVTAGPNGGHVVKSAAGFSFEVVVDKQRKAHFTLLDEKGQALAAGETAVEGIAGERSNPVALKFVKGEDGKLTSDAALPEGAHVPMILTIKTGPDAKPVTERFELHLH